MESFKLNIVFLVSRFPYPLTKGDRLRAFYQIKELSKHHHIHLIALSDVSISSADQKILSPYCASIDIQKLSKFSILFRMFWAVFFSSLPLQVCYFFSRKVKKRIHDKIDQLNPDVLYCQLVRTSEYVKEIQHIPKYLDLMDAMSAGMERRAEKSNIFNKWIWNKETQRLKKYEHHILKHFQNVSIISKADQAKIVSYFNPQIKVIPNGVDTDYFEFNVDRNSKVLLFTGNMSYPPNVESAIFLATEILPLILKEDNQVQLVIAGANPVKKIRDLKSNHVNITGWTEDIREYYNKAAIFIAPMLIGSGLQNKLLEAMACGIPCITSTLANNSLGAKEENEILIGQTAAEYAELAMKLLNNKSLAKEIGKNGYTFVKNQFNWTANVNKLENDLTNIVKSHRDE